MKFIILRVRMARNHRARRFTSELKSNHILTMNLTAVILFFTCLQVSAEVFPQRITLSEKNAPLKTVIREIKAQSGYQILFNSDLIEKAKPVTINVINASLTEALDLALENQSLIYQFSDRTILIGPSRVSLLKQRQEKSIPPVKITGKVSDSGGGPLVGVSVIVKGTNIGMATDAQGRFSLTAPNDAVLVFSLVGFTSREIPVNGRTTINVQLDEGLGALSEVVVTGYSREAKKDIVGSVSVVNTNELLSTPSGNVSSQLQGRAAGVTVSTNGELGGSAKVRIRGFGSFTGSDPLYIIDGVPASSGIDNLNPDDIESLQVLKDASSASIYGARAANGVIIITTKKGKNGPVKVNVSGYNAINSVNRSDFPDLLNAQEYGEMYWKQMEGAGYKVGDPGWNHPQYGNGARPVIPEYILVRNNNVNIGGAELERIRISDPSRFQALTDPSNYNFITNQIVRSADTDWFNEFYNPALQQNYNVSVTGGSDNGSYMLSLNHFNQKSTSVETNFFKRYSLTANASYNISKHIRVGENLRLSYVNSNRSNPYPEAAWTMLALIPVYDIMGNPASTAAPGTSGSEGYNPITEGYRNRFDRNDNVGIFGNVYAEADVIKGLTARTSFGFDRFSRTIRDFSARTYEHGENFNNNSLLSSENHTNSWTWTNTLNYSHTFAKDHDLKLLVGTEAIKTFNEFLSATRLDFPIDQQENPDFHVINAGLGSQTNSGSFGRNSLFSLFSRMDYAYQGKYLFNATLRRDASSKFSRNNRVGYFPAAALGWRLSAEPFMKGMEWIDDMKLRASWGIIGNQTGLSSDN
ncbi:SusC/RagA family TonB-linked outer membrane protein, partial [Arcticibacter sp.]|uniref:SusC/RagA family TonB-linked outer membrane protein n=1 Tax=Arcticibacter sp. TaxID=1872630 RepID=UPI0038907F07